MTQDNIKEYIVCINGGSGVIFQPLDNTCTYILTAKHVFDDNDTSSDGKVHIYYYSSIKKEFELIPAFDLSEGVNYFPHSQKEVDLAILKVARFDGANNLIIKDDIGTDTEDYILVGFPLLRRRVNPINLNWIRHDLQVTILQQREFQRREADIRKNQNWNELVGSSGGGIFKISGDYLLLAGIQSQVIDLEEALGRVEITPSTLFKEIVSNSNGRLEDLLPNYMKCFSFLKDIVLNLEGCWIEDFMKQASNQLKLKAAEINIKPFEIYNSEIGSFLLVSKEPLSSIYTKEIWSSWLIYLIVLSIITGKSITIEEVKDQFNSVRLIHSNSNQDWMRIMRGIFKSDFRGLADKGTLIVSNNHSATNRIVTENMIADIASVNSVEGKFMTDTSRHPLTMFKFIHISAFEIECIISQEQDLKEFIGIKIDQLISNIKIKFDEILKSGN